MKLARLRDWRREANLSQFELAERSRVPQNAISNYESGKRGARYDNAERLARALGAEVDDLVEEGAAETDEAGDPIKPGPEMAEKYKGWTGRVRVRRDIKRYGLEWGLETMETALEKMKGEREGDKKAWGEWQVAAHREVVREFARRLSREKGEYTGRYMAYLRDTIRDEYQSYQMFLSAADDVLSRISEGPSSKEDLERVDRDLEEMKERLDKTKKEVEELQESLKVQKGKAG